MRQATARLEHDPAAMRGRDSRGDDAIARAVPLIDRLISGGREAIAVREIAPAWLYEYGNRQVTTGWNPLSGRVYVPSGSVLRAWLSGETEDLRALNPGDRFVRELCFLAHDLIHVWSVRLVQDLVPEQAFGQGEITADTLDAHAFVLLVTEACATVGLDYWYLSTFELEQRLRIGTCFQRLTVDYRSADDAEYRRACPDFDAQTPAFFARIARFYCTGVFPGFNARDALRSPRLHAWLDHELEYGQTQRRYAREWLMHLGGLPTERATPSSLHAAVACDAPWQREVIDALATRLWSLIKDEGEFLIAPRADTANDWRAPARGPIDARFTNIAALSREEVRERGVHAPTAPYYIEQVLRGAPEVPRDAGIHAAVRAARERRDIALAEWLADTLGAGGAAREDLRDLFFLA
jgi:hypothetical protein